MVVDPLNKVISYLAFRNYCRFQKRKFEELQETFSSGSYSTIQKDAEKRALYLYKQEQAITFNLSFQMVVVCVCLHVTQSNKALSFSALVCLLFVCFSIQHVNCVTNYCVCTYAHML